MTTAKEVMRQTPDGSTKDNMRQTMPTKKTSLTKSHTL